jgi:hypothetical protein
MAAVPSVYLAVMCILSRISHSKRCSAARRRVVSVAPSEIAAMSEDS